MESKRNHSHFQKIKTLQTPSLPQEIVEEILSRLPVKSLLKFRCVSKLWCSLIGNKKFIKSHLENSSNNTNFTHHRIISNFFVPHDTLKHCSVPSLLYEPLTDGYAFDFLSNDSEVSIDVVGCCNGLICLIVKGKHFYLWNPTTRKSKKLPDFDNDMLMGCFFITKCGFGYDEANDDYKVFGLLSLFWIAGRYEARGKIYSLKANSWKIIENFKDVSPFDESGLFVSGKLHWIKKFGYNYQCDIISFDLKSAVYETVEQPSYLEIGSYPKLGVLGGCLCVGMNHNKIQLDIWVLKNYGDKESWAKLVSVPYLCDPLQGPFSTPLCIGSKGEVLFICGSAFAVYYPKDNRFWRPQITNFDEFHGADVYVESLVSLVSDGEQERRN